MRNFSSFALLVVLSTAVAGARDASAQAASAQDALARSASPSTVTTFGKIEGTVFDSLLMRPLVGANVWIPGTTHSTLTDARGRFVFDSVTTGHQVVAFSSSGLDSVGFSDLMGNAEVSAGKTAQVKLASPSRARLWSMLCATRPTIGSDSGIAVGTVHDGDTNARLAQAPVTFGWYNLASSQSFGPVSQNVRTDSTGAYYACGLPTDVQLTSEAFGNKAQSGEVQYQIGERRFIRLDLVASSEMTVGSARAGTAIVRGFVVNENRAPVADADVFLSGADSTVRSGADGSFVIRGVPSGTLVLQARKVGTANTASIVNVRRGENVQTTVVLNTATNLATVKVAGERPKSFEMQAFEDRQKMGFGMAFDFTKNEPATSLAPLSAVPRVKVAYPRGGAATISMTVDGGQRTCVAVVYLDGRRSDTETISTYPVNLLAAMEVYSSPYQVPAQYMLNPVAKATDDGPRRNSAYTPINKSAVTIPKDSLSGACGVVLYWTKAVLRP